jgi:hypothetical protein
LRGRNRWQYARRGQLTLILVRADSVRFVPVGGLHRP